MADAEGKSHASSFILDGCKISLSRSVKPHPFL